MKTNNKTKDTRFWLVSSIIFLLGILWVHTSIKMLSFLMVYDEFELILTSCTVAFLTWLVYAIIGSLDFSFSLHSTRFYILRFACSFTLLIGLYWLETKTTNYSLFVGDDIMLWNWSIPKIHLYYFFIIIWFPANISLIFKAMEKEKFNMVSRILGAISICAFTLEELLLFKSFGNAYKIDMFLLNCITIGIAMWKHGQSISKRKQIILILLYLIFWICLLPLCCEHWSSNLTLFMFGSQDEEYPQAVHEIVTHAALFGPSEYLLNSEFVVIWLFNQNMPILQVLYYGGWIAGIGYISFLLGLVISFIKNLNFKKGRNHRFFLIYATAAAYLVMEILLGILLNFGIPYLANIPFFNGYWSFIMFTLVFICGKENIAIYQNESFVSSKEILKKAEPYVLLDKYGNAYHESDDIYEYVSIDKQYFEIEPFVNQTREFAVLTTMSFLNKKRFILENVDDSWVEPKDSKFQKWAVKYYKYHNIPEYLEDTIYEENNT